MAGSQEQPPRSLVGEDESRLLLASLCDQLPGVPRSGVVVPRRSPSSAPYSYYHDAAGRGAGGARPAASLLFPPAVPPAPYFYSNLSSLQPIMSTTINRTILEDRVIRQINQRRRTIMAARLAAISRTSTATIARRSPSSAAAGGLVAVSQQAPPAAPAYYYTAAESSLVAEHDPHGQPRRFEQERRSTTTTSSSSTTTAAATPVLRPSLEQGRHQEDENRHDEYFRLLVTSSTNTSAAGAATSSSSSSSSRGDTTVSSARSYYYDEDHRHHDPPAAHQDRHHHDAAGAVLLRGGSQDRNKEDEDEAKNSNEEKETSGWEFMFREMDTYRRRHQGSCLVKERDNPRLGRWIRHQRKMMRQGKLNPERIRRLDSIGFIWKSTYQETWEIMFRSLEVFKKTHGHCLVPRTYKKDPRLGRWVDTQRNRDRGELGPERVKRLDDAGFVWNVHEQTWHTMFQRLCKFKDRYGHCMVPSIFPDDPKLGSWIHVQRSRKQSLPKDRIAKLNDVGFIWSMMDQKKESGRG